MRKYYTRIENIAGNVATLKASHIGYEELAVIQGKWGQSLCQVIRMAGEDIYLQVFSGTRGLSTGDQVSFLGSSMRFNFSDNLFGRIFSGGGEPRDHRSPLAENLVEVGGPAVNPAVRLMPHQMIPTNIPMIDVFNTLVEGQKLPIFSIPGEPYNELLARIALQAEADVIILGGMGLKYDEYLYFKNRLEAGGAMARSILFIHTASDPVVECLLTPDLALTVAENFAVRGKKVLVLLTDMTNFSNALKEIAITMEQIPSNRGYPGDLYSQLAARYEKAVVFENGGSVTIMAVTTMPGDDVTHPVPDNTGYITEGQFYLKGGYIEPFGSLSRLKQLVNGKTRDDHRAIMDGCIQLYAKCRESREKRAMGFEMSPWDVKLLNYGEAFENRIMDLSVNINLFDALNLSWNILAEFFEPRETGIRSSLCETFWPQRN
ncbi:V-type ATP synthase subunit B [Desulfoferrobacter suflitae]|uniref:V-type ATP synthase subunit B n=1 Tax=Desulfoferrobacter suflitae TaxID=2865782 RepID=UPI0021647D19|nr:V-type ATP synthase subunit B [Desulfoferrobacter suflitae]MCK8604120.1 V-type ATP synthase subunit B [Desulfoferrobacter suflitae]